MCSLAKEAGTRPASWGCCAAVQANQNGRCVRRLAATLGFLPATARTQHVRVVTLRQHARAPTGVCEVRGPEASMRTRIHV